MRKRELRHYEESNIYVGPTPKPEDVITKLCGETEKKILNGVARSSAARIREDAKYLEQAHQEHIQENGFLRVWCSSQPGGLPVYKSGISYANMEKLKILFAKPNSRPQDNDEHL